LDFIGASGIEDHFVELIELFLLNDAGPYSINHAEEKPECEPPTMTMFLY